MREPSCAYPEAMRTLGKLKGDAVALLVEYREHEGEREATPRILRDLAGVLVAMREHFVTDEGEPDWTGRTYAYRQTVRDVYREANIPAEDVSRIQAAVRYHAGSVLRERADVDAESIGISTDSPVERSRSQRAKRSAQLQAIRGGDPEGFVGLDALRALEGARGLLGRVNVKELREQSARDRKAAVDILAAMRDRVEALRRAAMTK